MHITIHCHGLRPHTFGATTVAALTTRLRTERLDEQTLSADGGEARPLFVKATAATPAPESCTDDILVCPLNNDYLRNGTDEVSLNW